MSIQLEVRRYTGGDRHRHDYSQILVPLCGSMVVDIEGYSGIVAGQCIGLLPQDRIHDFNPSADCRMLILDVEKTSLSDAGLPDLLIHQTPIIAPIDPWIWRMFHLLGEEIEANESHAPDAAKLAMAGLHLIKPTDRSPALPASKRRTLGIAQTLDDSAGSPCVAHLAEMAGLGQSQFHALFRVMTGTSPKQFQLAKRFERAIDQLINSSAPISEIAYSLGYQNVSSFNRMFRQRFGITPSDVRRTGRSLPQG